jgi:hypothetical protein
MGKAARESCASHVHEILLISPVVRVDYHKTPVNVARFLVTFGRLV